MNRLDGPALDRYITGNYGEDQFKEPRDDEPEAVRIVLPGAFVEYVKGTQWWTSAQSDTATGQDRYVQEAIEFAPVRVHGFGRQYQLTVDDWQEGDVRAILNRLATDLLDRYVEQIDGEPTPGQAAAARRVLADADSV